jgi:hypothetical protein
LRVADIFNLLSVSADLLLLAAPIIKASFPPTSNEKCHILLQVTRRSRVEQRADPRTDARADNDGDEVVDAVAEPEPLLGRLRVLASFSIDDREP